MYRLFVIGFSHRLTLIFLNNISLMVPNFRSRSISLYLQTLLRLSSLLHTAILLFRPVSPFLAPFAQFFPFSFLLLHTSTPNLQEGRGNLSQEELDLEKQEVHGKKPR